MKDGKDGFIERYGGVRPFETNEELKARMHRIDELMAKDPKTAADIDEIVALKGPGLPHLQLEE